MSEGTGEDFRAIKGVGVALALRLRAAGLDTMGDLAAADPDELVVRLTGVRALSAARIVGWIAQARERVAAGSEPAPANREDPGDYAAEKRLTFVVEIVRAAGRPARSRVTDARSQEERSWAGWPREEVLRFIEERAGVATARRPASATGDGSAEPHPAVLDLGLAVETGSGVECHVRTDGLADQGIADFRYAATLTARDLGGSAARPIGQTSGSGRAGDDLALRFATRDGRRAVIRLGLTIDVTPAPAGAARPALAIVGPAGRPVVVRAG